LGDLSETFIWTDDHATAEQLARRAILIFEATVPAVHPDRVRTESVLAEALSLQNRPSEAASLLADAVRKNTELFGYVSPQVADILDRLAIAKYAEKRFSESEDIGREALATARITFGSKHLMTGNIATTLARTLVRLHKYSEAEPLLREALNVFAATLPSDHQYIASAEYFLGEVLIATKRSHEAETVLTASMNRWQRAGAPSWRAMRCASALGEALYQQGRIQEAEKYLLQSLHEISADAKADPEAKEEARERIARYARKNSHTQRGATEPTLTVTAH
jgi:tetratricopeptide (TPR) repeat protein